MRNRQIITPDDFYDALDAVESGRSTQIKILLPKHVRDELFLESVSIPEILLSFLSLDYNIFTIDLDVNEAGALIITRAPKPNNSKLTDLGGLDNE